MRALHLNAHGWTWTRAAVAVEGPSHDAMWWRCGPDSDLWRLTAGGPIKHDPYAYIHQTSGDFTLEGVFDGELSSRYDQVGFVALACEQSWLKAGFELDAGEVLLSAVHSGAYSDWSCAPSTLPGALRVRRRSGTIEVACSDGRRGWRMIRQLFLDGPVNIGPYSAAPLGPGFGASLTSFAFHHDLEE